MNYVIIGMGVAALSALDAIRSVDKTGSVTVIGADPHGFYSRPGLAYYLNGELPEKSLFPLPKHDLKKHQADFMRATVRRILPQERRIELSNGKILGYDRLLLALGASAVPIRTPGYDLDGVVKIDHLNDTNQIIKLAKRKKDAVVIGGGITALELVEGLAARKVRVHYFLRGDRYWSSVLDDDESRIILKRLQEEGVIIHTYTEAAEILGKRGKVSGLRTKDGETVKAQMVAYAIGIRPRLELAQAAGIAIERGILANQFLQTSIPNIYAAGDVAQVYDPMSGRAILDSLWNPARDQGYTAGLNMAGKTTPYHKSAPFNVTRLAGLTTTIIGTVGNGMDEDLLGIARGDSETWRQLPDAIAAQSGFDTNRLRLMLGDKKIIGAIVMGDQTLSTPIQKLVEAEADVSPIRKQLLAPHAPIADIIADFWTNWRKENAKTQ
jgi:NAD(P)H-nitrite reductase large subunit